VPKDTQSAPALLANAHVDAPAYARMYSESVRDPEAFWGEHGKRLDWIKPYSKVKNTSFAHDNVDIRWFEDGTLNVAANCIDRHLAKRGDQTAIIFEPDDPKEAAQHITYKQLHAEVGRFANVLKELGVGRGDRVVLYLPDDPRGRLRDAGLRADRRHPFGRLRRILARCACQPGQRQRGEGRRDLRRRAARGPGDGAQGQRQQGAPALRRPCEMPRREADRPAGRVDRGARRLVRRHRLDRRHRVPGGGDGRRRSALHPLHLGSTGKPKGVVHTSGGYLVYAR
jgi:acetyl-CoA synthetase